MAQWLYWRCELRTEDSSERRMELNVIEKSQQGIKASEMKRRWLRKRELSEERKGGEEQEEAGDSV
eukprot:scaffold11077_cov78-Cyclotella_meneghiniana.AAC.1